MVRILPGWDSLDAVVRWHRLFEITGFVALGLLLLFEVLAYAYGNRKDQLTSASQEAAAQERQRRERGASEERDARIAQVNRRAAAAEELQKRAEQRAAPRRLTETQKAKISSFLSGKPRGTFRIIADLRVPDARAYAEDISNLFGEAGWTVGVEDAVSTVSPANGLWITVKNPQAPPIAAVTLGQAFAAAGITVRGEHDPTFASLDQVWLSVGAK